MACASTAPQPRAPAGKYPLNDAVRGLTYRELSIEDTFTTIYKTDAWGKGSGAGSVPVHCLKWIEFVRKFIRGENIRSVVDLGCGDWQFSPYIYHDLGVKYTGYDVVLPVIAANRENWGSQGYTFKHLDFSVNVPDIEDADLYILKDVLQHWSSARITRFLREIIGSKPNLRYLLVCNCAEPEDWPEEDIVDGGWRPLFASRPPLSQFQPAVLLHFPSLPNKKEVCLIRPDELRRGAADSPRAALAGGELARGAQHARGPCSSTRWEFFRSEGCRRRHHPPQRPRFVPL